MTRLSSVPAFRPFILLLLAIIIASFFTSCRNDNSLFGIRGSGPAVTEIRMPGNFHGVALSLDADVVLHYDSNCRVEITAQQNILNVLDTDIRGGILELGFDKNVNSHSNITIHIYAPAYDEARISGSGSISNQDSIQAGSLTTKISGSGSITLGMLNCGAVRSSISGSGNTTLYGQCTSSDLSISGSGNIYSFGLTGVSSSSTISGSGNIEVNVTQTLHARISGSGSIYYKNTPALDVSISGSGEVIHVN